MKVLSLKKKKKSAIHKKDYIQVEKELKGRGLSNLFQINVFIYTYRHFILSQR